MSQILWELRYRSPLSPTKGVDDVVIATDTDSYADAKALADWFLEHKMASPSTRFVYVRRLVVATSEEMRQRTPSAADEEPTGPSPVQAASRSAVMQPANRDEMSGVGAEARPSKPSGRVGA